MDQNHDRTDELAVLYIAGFFPPGGLPEDLFGVLLPDKLLPAAEQLLQQNVLVHESSKIGANTQASGSEAASAHSEEALQRFVNRLVIYAGLIGIGRPELFGQPLDGSFDIADDDDTLQRMLNFHRETNGAILTLAENILPQNPTLFRSSSFQLLALYCETCQEYAACVRYQAMALKRGEQDGAALSSLVRLQGQLHESIEQLSGARANTLGKYLPLYYKIRKEG